MEHCEQNGYDASQLNQSANRPSTSTINQPTDQSSSSSGRSASSQPSVNWDTLVDQVFHDEIKDFNIELNRKANMLEKQK